MIAPFLYWTSLSLTPTKLCTLSPNFYPRVTLRKFELQGGFGGGDLKICSDYRGFRVTEIRVIEIFLRKIDRDFEFVRIIERFGLESQL